MAYVVTEACIKCKYTDCVEVCPVDCFHEGENMLFIDPEVCIDCGVCEPECPVDAIKDGESAPMKWLEINAKFSKITPVIATHKTPPSDADNYKNEQGKLEKYAPELMIDEQ